jgi:hypothetical protein
MAVGKDDSERLYAPSRICSRESLPVGVASSFTLHPGVPLSESRMACTSRVPLLDKALCFLSCWFLSGCLSARLLLLPPLVMPLGYETRPRPSLRLEQHQHHYQRDNKISFGIAAAVQDRSSSQHFSSLQKYAA